METFSQFVGSSSPLVTSQHGPQAPNQGCQIGFLCPACSTESWVQIQMRDVTQRSQMGLSYISYIGHAVFSAFNESTSMIMYKKNV